MNKTTNRSGIGSLYQLAAKGSQGEHIHAKGTAFLFQSEYKRHTLFGLLQKEVEIKDVSLGTKIVVEIPRDTKGDGHMMTNMILKIKLPKIKNDSNKFIYRNYLAYILLRKIKFKLNDQVIQEYNGEYLFADYILNSKKHIDEMLGIRKIDSIVNFLDNTIEKYQSEQDIYIPLPLWDNPTLEQYFPIASIYKQHLYLEITFCELRELVISEGEFREYQNINITPNESKGTVDIQITTVPQAKPEFEISDTSCTLYLDQIMLDEKEKSQLIQQSQKYVFVQPQLQIIPISRKLPGQSGDFNVNNITIDLQCTLPVKQLIWFITNEEHVTDFSPSQFSSFTDARFLFGDTDNGGVMQQMSSSYYSLVQSFHHNQSISPEYNIFSYSFALQPSSGHINGSINFGKLLKKILEIHGNSFQNKYLKIYAICYNVFNTGSGHGTVAFR